MEARVTPRARARRMRKAKQEVQTPSSTRPLFTSSSSDEGGADTADEQQDSIQFPPDLLSHYYVRDPTAQDGYEVDLRITERETVPILVLPSPSASSRMGSATPSSVAMTPRDLDTDHGAATPTSAGPRGSTPGSSALSVRSSRIPTPPGYTSTSCALLGCTSPGHHPPAALLHPLHPLEPGHHMRQHQPHQPHRRRTASPRGATTPTALQTTPLTGGLPPLPPPPPRDSVSSGSGRSSRSYPAVSPGPLDFAPPPRSSSPLSRRSERAGSGGSLAAQGRSAARGTPPHAFTPPTEGGATPPASFRSPFGYDATASRVGLLPHQAQGRSLIPQQQQYLQAVGQSRAQPQHPPQTHQRPSPPLPLQPSCGSKIPPVVTVAHPMHPVLGVAGAGQHAAAAPPSTEKATAPNGEAVAAPPVAAASTATTGEARAAMQEGPAEGGWSAPSTPRAQAEEAAGAASLSKGTGTEGEEQQVIAVPLPGDTATAAAAEVDAEAAATPSVSSDAGGVGREDNIAAAAEGSGGDGFSAPSGSAGGEEVVDCSVGDEGAADGQKPAGDREEPGQRSPPGDCPDLDVVLAVDAVLAVNGTATGGLSDEAFTVADGQLGGAPQPDVALAACPPKPTAAVTPEANPAAAGAQLPAEPAGVPRRGVPAAVPAGAGSASALPQPPVTPAEDAGVETRQGGSDGGEGAGTAGALPPGDASCYLSFAAKNVGGDGDAPTALSVHADCTVGVAAATTAQPAAVSAEPAMAAAAAAASGVAGPGRSEGALTGPEGELAGPPSRNEGPSSSAQASPLQQPPPPLALARRPRRSDVCLGMVSGGGGGEGHVRVGSRTGMYEIATVVRGGGSPAIELKFNPCRDAERGAAAASPGSGSQTPTGSRSSFGYCRSPMRASPPHGHSSGGYGHRCRSGSGVGTAQYGDQRATGVLGCAGDVLLQDMCDPAKVAVAAASEPQPALAGEPPAATDAAQCLAAPEATPSVHHNNPFEPPLPLPFAATAAAAAAVAALGAAASPTTAAGGCASRPPSLRAGAEATAADATTAGGASPPKDPNSLSFWAAPTFGEDDTAGCGVQTPPPRPAAEDVGARLAVDPHEDALPLPTAAPGYIDNPLFSPAGTRNAGGHVNHGSEPEGRPAGGAKPDSPTATEAVATTEGFAQPSVGSVEEDFGGNGLSTSGGVSGGSHARLEDPGLGSAAALGSVPALASRPGLGSVRSVDFGSEAGAAPDLFRMPLPCSGGLRLMDGNGNGASPGRLQPSPRVMTGPVIDRSAASPETGGRQASGGMRVLDLTCLRQARQDLSEGPAGRTADALEAQQQCSRGAVGGEAVVPAGAIQAVAYVTLDAASAQSSDSLCQGLLSASSPCKLGAPSGVTEEPPKGTAAALLERGAAESAAGPSFSSEVPGAAPPTPAAATASPSAMSAHGVSSSAALRASAEKAQTRPPLEDPRQPKRRRTRVSWCDEPVTPSDARSPVGEATEPLGCSTVGGAEVTAASPPEDGAEETAASLPESSAEETAASLPEDGSKETASSLSENRAEETAAALPESGSRETAAALLLRLEETAAAMGAKAAAMLAAAGAEEAALEALAGALQPPAGPMSAAAVQAAVSEPGEPVASPVQQASDPPQQPLAPPQTAGGAGHGVGEPDQAGGAGPLPAERKCLRFTGIPVTFAPGNSSDDAATPLDVTERPSTGGRLRRRQTPGVRMLGAFAGIAFGHDEEDDAATTSPQRTPGHVTASLEQRLDQEAVADSDGAAQSGCADNGAEAHLLAGLALLVAEEAGLQPAAAGHLPACGATGAPVSKPGAEAPSNVPKSPLGAAPVLGVTTTPADVTAVSLGATAELLPAFSNWPETEFVRSPAACATPRRRYVDVVAAAAAAESFATAAADGAVSVAIHPRSAGAGKPKPDASVDGLKAAVALCAAAAQCTVAEAAGPPGGPSAPALAGSCAAGSPAPSVSEPTSGRAAPRSSRSRLPTPSADVAAAKSPASEVAPGSRLPSGAAETPDGKKPPPPPPPSSRPSAPAVSTPASASRLPSTCLQAPASTPPQQEAAKSVSRLPFVGTATASNSGLPSVQAGNSSSKLRSVPLPEVSSPTPIRRLAFGVLEEPVSQLPLPAAGTAVPRGAATAPRCPQGVTGAVGCERPSSKLPAAPGCKPPLPGAATSASGGRQLSPEGETADDGKPPVPAAVQYGGPWPCRSGSLVRDAAAPPPGGGQRSEGAAERTPGGKLRSAIPSVGAAAGVTEVPGGTDPVGVARTPGSAKVPAASRIPSLVAEPGVALSDADFDDAQAGVALSDAAFNDTQAGVAPSNAAFDEAAAAAAPGGPLATPPSAAAQSLQFGLPPAGVDAAASAVELEAKEPVAAASNVDGDCPEALVGEALELEGAGKPPAGETSEGNQVAERSVPRLPLWRLGATALEGHFRGGSDGAGTAPGDGAVDHSPAFVSTATASDVDDSPAAVGPDGARATAETTAAAAAELQAAAETADCEVVGVGWLSVSVSLLAVAGLVGLGMLLVAPTAPHDPLEQQPANPTNHHPLEEHFGAADLWASEPAEQPWGPVPPSSAVVPPAAGAAAAAEAFLSHPHYEGSAVPAFLHLDPTAVGSELERLLAEDVWPLPPASGTLPEVAQADSEPAAATQRGVGEEPLPEVVDVPWPSAAGSESDDVEGPTAIAAGWARAVEVEVEVEAFGASDVEEPARGGDAAADTLLEDERPAQGSKVAVTEVPQRESEEAGSGEAEAAAEEEEVEEAVPPGGEEAPVNGGCAAETAPGEGPQEQARVLEETPATEPGPTDAAPPPEPLREAPVVALAAAASTERPDSSMGSSPVGLESATSAAGLQSQPHVADSTSQSRVASGSGSAAPSVRAPHSGPFIGYLQLAGLYLAAAVAGVVSALLRLGLHHRRAAGWWSVWDVNPTGVDPTGVSAGGQRRQQQEGGWNGGLGAPPLMHPAVLPDAYDAYVYVGEEELLQQQQQQQQQDEEEYHIQRWEQEQGDYARRWVDAYPQRPNDEAMRTPRAHRGRRRTSGGGGGGAASTHSPRNSIGGGGASSGHTGGMTFHHLRNRTVWVYNAQEMSPEARRLVADSNYT